MQLETVPRIHSAWLPCLLGGGKAGQYEKQALTEHLQESNLVLGTEWVQSREKMPTINDSSLSPGVSEDRDGSTERRVLGGMSEWRDRSLI